MEGKLLNALFSIVVEQMLQMNDLELTEETKLKLIFYIYNYIIGYVYLKLKLNCIVLPHSMDAWIKQELDIVEKEETT